MLNEYASAASDYDAKVPSETNYTPDPFTDLRQQVAEIMEIVDEYTPAHPAEAVMMTPHDEYVRVFEGQLTMNSEAAYDHLDTLLAPDDRFALFRHNPDSDRQDTRHEIHILAGRVTPVEGAPWLNLALFLATLASVLFVGASYAVAGMDPETARTMLREITLNGEVVARVPHLSELWRGYPYALSLMLILGAHELGHYFAARYHGHAVSLPYFIPLPFVGLGTMGAVIRSREPMRNRKVLVDIGAAGPLAGLVFAIPILFIGLATSEVSFITGEGIREGNSILYALMKFAALGQFYPTATRDVFINQMAFAGWLGLFVTALNLIPVGQLDGGHVMYSLFGIKARRIYYPVLIAMIGLTLLTPIWFLWVVLLFLLGRVYAPPLDDITPLDMRRRGVGVATLLVFILVFVPIPFAPVQLEQGAPAPANSVQHTPPSLQLTLDD